MSRWATLLALLLLVGCTAAPVPSPAPSASPLVWRELPLPGDAVPYSLGPAANEVLVGGSTATTDGRPVLISIGPDLRSRSVPVQGTSPYAVQTKLISVAAHDDRILALGGTRGGAHFNVRWSAWEGTTRTTLAERPQSFGTFGGVGAGDLLAVLAAEEPAIVGTWGGERGLDAAVWHLDGRRWVREPSARTALANTAARQVSPRAAAADGPAIVVAGSVLDLDADLRQTAAVWTRPAPTDPWTLRLLPEGGPHGEARSVRCDPDGCLVAGRVDGRLALWRLGPRGEPATVPAWGQVDEDSVLAVARHGGRPVVFGTRDGAVQLVTTADTGPGRTFAGPPGALVAAEVLGDRALVISADRGRHRLWHADLSVGD